MMSDIVLAFDKSGSVYYVDPDSGQVKLRVDEKLANDLRTAGDILSSSKQGREEFLGAVASLMNRKAAPEEIVKRVWVAFEDYLKSMTGSKDYSESVAKLEKQEVISPFQKSILDKLHGFRSDAYGVAHAGKSEKPKELDALWFIDTVTSQLLYIDRKLKQWNDSQP